MKNPLSQIVTTRSFQRPSVEKLSKRVRDHALLASSVIDAPNFTQINDTDLQRLFHLVDDNYFDGHINDFLKAKRFPLRFRLSKRMTSSGGITTMTGSRRKKQFEIAISSTLLFQSFRDQRPLSVTGVMCSTRVEALQRIMEHEMIHLVEMALWHDSSCAAYRFRNIASRLFGHKQSSHQLITPAEVAEKDRGIGIGSKVVFKFNGKNHTGFVNRVTKRATVLVRDRRGDKYDDGQRYVKFYVPISRLRRSA